MDLRIYAEGFDFRENSVLDSAIEILNVYDVIFKSCLEKAASRYGLVVESRPRLKLRSASPGSLDVQLVVEAAAAIAPLAPEIFNYSWTLFKSAYDLIGLAVNYFNRDRHPASIHITDSPGAVVLQAEGDITVTTDILDIARRQHPKFDKFAELVRKQRADLISLDAEIDSAPPRLVFNQSNQNDFKVKAIEVTEPGAIEFECNIYHLNTKRLSGYLEYLQDDDGPTAYPFKIDADLLDACIDALKLPIVRVSAARDMEVNALGEKKIKRFQILSLEETEGDQHGAPVSPTTHD